MIAIIDYGMGNIHSVQKALETLGAKTIVTNKPKDLRAVDKIVLPGVGAFADALKELEVRGLVTEIKAQVLDKKKIFLGICLGMQMLFERSEESPSVAGLGILKGKVKGFTSHKNLKVPHMGWNELLLKKKACPLFHGLPDSPYVYFCHSYYPQPDDKRAIAATCDYAKDFAAVIWQENILGVQFHPEKSQENGIMMLKNFVKRC